MTRSIVSHPMLQNGSTWKMDGRRKEFGVRLTSLKLLSMYLLYIYIRHRSNLFLHVNKNNANVQMERNRKDKCWVFSFHSWLISKGVSYYSYSSNETELN